MGGEIRQVDWLSSGSQEEEKCRLTLSWLQGKEGSSSGELTCTYTVLEKTGTGVVSGWTDRCPTDTCEMGAVRVCE